MYLIGVYLTGVHLMGIYLINVHLTGVHLIGVYLTGVYLIDVYLTCVYLEPDGRARASFWVGPGLAYLVRTTVDEGRRWEGSGDDGRARHPKASELA